MGFEGYDTSNGRLGILGYIYIICIHIIYRSFLPLFQVFLSLHYHFSTEAKKFFLFFSLGHLTHTYHYRKLMNHQDRLTFLSPNRTPSIRFGGWSGAGPAEGRRFFFPLILFKSG